MKTLGRRLQTLDVRRAMPPPKETLPFYLSKEWRGLMAGIFKARGRACESLTCEDPRAAGVRYGDHIVELKDGGAALDAGNIMVLCARCHGIKGAKAARERARRLDQSRRAEVAASPSNGNR